MGFRLGFILRSWPCFLVSWTFDRIWGIKTCFDISTSVCLFLLLPSSKDRECSWNCKSKSRAEMTDKSQWYGSTWFPPLSRASSSPRASVDHPAQPGLSDEWHLCGKPSCSDHIKLSPLLPNLGFPFFPLSLTLFCMPLWVKDRASNTAPFLKKVWT